MLHWPFTVIDRDGSPFIKVDYLSEEKTFSPQEISAMVLGKMKEISEAKLGKTVSKAVVTSVHSRSGDPRPRSDLSLQCSSLFQRFATIGH